MRENNDLLILLVDDDGQLADLLSLWLTAAGFKSIIASNGQEAINRFRQDNFDAVVLDLDLGLPPDGFGVLEAIRGEKSDVPVIMMSGRTSSNVRICAIQKGVYAFLVKPFDSRDLLHLIATATREKELGKKRRPS